MRVQEVAIAMKQIVFSRNNEGQLKARVIKNTALQADGSTVNISDSLLEEALRTGIFQEKAYARGYNNIYYRCNNVTLLRVSENQVIIIDSYLGSKTIEDDEFEFNDCNSDLENVWLADIFKDKSVAIKRATGHKHSRGIPRMSLQKVTHQGLEKDSNGNYRKIKKVSYNHPVELGTIIYALNDGRISTMERHKNWHFSLNKMQLHHDGYDWDNRICQTMYLTEQEHTEYHTQIGEWSHQCAVLISTLEELVAFLEFIQCYQATR